MADYQRSTIRLICAGLNLVWPSDKMPPGKFPRLLNVRAVGESDLQPRAGFTQKYNLGGAVHSLARLNDATPYNGGVDAIEVTARGTDLYRSIVGANVPAIIDSNYSGDPLTLLAAQPVGTPQPFLYVMDRQKNRKVNTAGTVLKTGIDPPNTVPGASLAQPSLTILEDSSFSGLPPVWLPAGNGGPAAVALRVNAHADVVLYDSGATGNALIALDDNQQLGGGMTVTIGGEATLVQSVRPATVPTTIAAILYDSGANGLCTIQPAASLGSGHIQLPTPDQVLQRNDLGRGRYAVPRGTFGSPINALGGTQEAAAVNFPVDCLVQIGTEWVRIISSNMGPDGVQSFRCTTTSTHVVGEAITGRTALRVYLVNAHTAGEAVLDNIAQNELVTGSIPEHTDPSQVGGVQTCNPDGTSGYSRDASIIGGAGVFAIGPARAMQPDDEFHLSLRINKLYAVEEVRIYIDVDSTTKNFTQNFYQQTFTVNDLIQNIQAVDATAVTTQIQTLEDTIVPAETARGVVTPSGYTQDANAPVTGGRSGNFPGRPGSLTPQQQQLALGNSQWMELRWKVRDMTHVGTDEARSLANVTSIGVFIQYDGTVAGGAGSTVDVAYDAFYLTGGYGTDAAASGVPYIWTYRYRNSSTGEKSNPAPPIPGSVIGAPTGLLPRRQRVNLTGTPSGQAGVDKMDWFRFGGTLTSWTYVGSGPNTGDEFHDDFADQAVIGGEALEFDNFALWPTIDQPRVGTCNVAGSAIQWVSGDQFNTDWAPGSQIKVNGIPYTLYSSPASASRLTIAENAGALTGVPFELPNPTVQGVSFPTFWGPLEGHYFSIDTNTNELIWTKANNPDTASDKNRAPIESPSEALINGYVRDGFGFVWSSENLYRIEYQPNLPVIFQIKKTPCGRGLWSPWAFSQGPEGVFFLTKDGIGITDRGSPFISLTNDDLYPIFPHDGESGVAVNGVGAPDMANPTRLRLNYIDGFVYFDYAT